MFQLLERVRTPDGVKTRWIRESATKVATFPTYKEAEIAAERIARDPWRKVSIVSMRRPGEIAAMHAQHLEDARTWRKLAASEQFSCKAGLVSMARESLAAAKAVRIGLA